MNGGSSVWAITPEERGKHDKQFDTLAPVLGYISGEQARKFFLQSGLPASVLAEIWNLADMDSDGKMDRLEFSIAMKLIKLTLQGRNLPSSLPITMKQPPTTSNSSFNMSSSARFGMGSMPNLSVGLSPMPSISTMPILTPIQANPPLPSVQHLVPVPMTLPLISSVGNLGLPNGSVSLLTPQLVPSNAGTPMSGFSSPMAFSPSPGVSKANSLLDLGSSSSNSSSTTSLASNSPKMGSGDWAVPQASRLKYRQQFNTLDKLMSGYLSGPQVRNALMASNLTQTQLATIWSLADVDKDGQLRAEEFILAMHLVDMAKTGHPLPLTLPQDLIPPSLRGGMKCGELVNGTGPYISPSLIDTTEIEPIQKNKSGVSYEDKLKENFARGSAELEKRRLALEEEQRKERERREREEREAQERREKEARELENRRRLEEERRLERQREMERQREEERLRELERKEAERQRREEWERAKKEELRRRKEEEQEEISRLRAKKKSLELELEAVGNKHKQISDRLRDAQSKRRIQKAEVELINQKRDTRIAEISTLQLEFEDWQRKLLKLIPEQQQMSEKLQSISLKKPPSATLTSLTGSAAERSGNCRRLKDQLDILERETTDKLAQMEQYNKELKELREKQRLQQAILDDLQRVKEEKLKLLQRRKEEEERERRRREEAEAARLAKLEEEKSELARIEKEKREKEEEEERQRRLQEEQRARQREEEEREAQARLRAAQEKAQEEERRQREEERRQREEERKQREEERRQREEERKKRELEEEMKRKQMEEEKRRNEEQEKGAVQLTTYRALYSFVARNADELSIDADCVIEVDEHNVGEPGWLCGNYQGKRGWFPQSYAQKCPTSSASETSPSSSVKTSNLPPVHARNTVPDAAEESIVPHFSHASQSSVPLTVRAVSSWSPTSENHLNSSWDISGAMLNFSQGDLISVLQQRDEWWLGQLNGTRGWFPKSYVTPEPGCNAEAETTDLSDSAQLEEYVALYTYESPETGDLTFDEGDVIMVTEREGEWWRGCIGDQTGLFPSNYVRPVEPEASRPGISSKKPEIVQAVTAMEAPIPYQLTLSPGQLIVVRAKNSTGWWLGELQARGKKRQKGWFHSSHVKLLGPSSTKTSLSPLPVCQVIAMYDYAAANQDELSFSKGQFINILDKTNPDWWKGEVNGVTGLLPTNYVKMTTESDPSQQ